MIYEKFFIVSIAKTSIVIETFNFDTKCRPN